jgi:glycosyltransferase involved in cell wall biosynthesis
LAKSAIQNSDVAAIVASTWMLKKVKQSPIWEGKNIYLLPFGVNQKLFKSGDVFEARKDLNIPLDDIVLMFRSNDIGEFKGIDIIMNTLNHLPDTHKITLIVVGEKGKLEHVQDKFNVIEFDWVDSDEQMVKLYQSCDIFLMPSRQETFGMMAIEAMSCGKMVLSIRGDGTALPDIIDSPNSGIAVDESEYTQELVRLLNNKQEVAERGIRSFQYARNMYSEEIYIEKLLGIYHEVISKKQYDGEAMLLLQQLQKYSIELNAAPVWSDVNKELITNLNDIYSSRSWRITKPLRLAGHLYRCLRDYGVAKTLIKVNNKLLNKLHES